METELNLFTEGAAEIMHQGTRMLAVSSGLSNIIFKQISRQELLSQEGWLYSGEQFVPWKCDDSVEIKGELFFPGPWHNGRSLADTELSSGILIKLAMALKASVQRKVPLQGLFTSGIYLTEKREVLFFPPNLMRSIREYQTDEKTVELWQPYNHPDIEGEEGLSFSLGVLAYRLLTGNLPYSGNSPTEIRDRMRKSSPVHVELLCPGLKSGIAGIINRTLKGELRSSDLDEWIEILKDWDKNGGFDKITEEERKEILLRTEKLVIKRDKAYLRKSFLHRNWKSFAVAVGIFAFIIAFSIQPIMNALEPPITVGMSAEEVVDTYYNGIIDMNVEIMEDCVNKGIGKTDIQEVTQLYVISRVRTGYEGKSGLISAQDWNDGVITELNPGEQVYGIANLEITQSSDLTFQADYIRWYPDIPDDPESTEIRSPIKTNVRDTLILEKIKDIWVIVSLERNIKE